MPKLLERASRVALDLFFPPQCGLCGRGGVLLCAGCIDQLPPADGKRCAVCWMPTSSEAVCRHCAERRPAFVSIRAAFIMDGGARRLAHELKYEGITSLAAPMAALMAQMVGPLSADVVVPVPLHRGRERARGYNQAAGLATQLGAALGLRSDPRAVRRVRATAPLAKTMHREERRAIVAGAFRASREHVDGRHVLLVDDVVTTGATLDACAEALRDAGASEIRCAVWARAD